MKMCFHLIPSTVRSYDAYSNQRKALFKALRNNPNIPSRGTFFKKLETKLNAKMELKLELSKI